MISILYKLSVIYHLLFIFQCLMDNGELIMTQHAKFGFILLLILTVTVVTFGAARFRLNKHIGVTFVCMYLLFLIYAFVQEFLCQGVYCWATWLPTPETRSMTRDIFEGWRSTKIHNVAVTAGDIYIFFVIFLDLYVSILFFLNSINKMNYHDL